MTTDIRLWILSISWAGVVTVTSSLVALTNDVRSSFRICKSQSQPLPRSAVLAQVHSHSKDGQNDLWPVSKTVACVSRTKTMYTGSELIASSLGFHFEPCPVCPWAVIRPKRFFRVPEIRRVVVRTPYFPAFSISSLQLLQAGGRFQCCMTHWTEKNCLEYLSSIYSLTTQGLFMNPIGQAPDFPTDKFQCTKSDE